MSAHLQSLGPAWFQALFLPFQPQALAKWRPRCPFPYRSYLRIHVFLPHRCLSLCDLVPYLSPVSCPSPFWLSECLHTLNSSLETQVGRRGLTPRLIVLCSVILTMIPYVAGGPVEGMVWLLGLIFIDPHTEPEKERPFP